MGDRLKGKRAFVTAAAVGIGRACAVAFAREGATVFATDIDEKGLASLAKDGVSEVARLDVRDSAAVAAMAKRVGTRSISCSTPQASCITAPIARLLRRTTGISRSTSTSSRCTGPSAAFLPGMLEDGRGSIVNIASAAGVFKAAPNRYVYGATKAAVAALTRAVAADFVARGIRLQLHLPRHHRNALDAGPRRSPPDQRPRDVRQPAADGTARHRRRNRPARDLSRQRREFVHDRRRPVIDGGWTL